MGLFARRRPARVGSPNQIGRKNNALAASGFKITRPMAGNIRRLVMPWQLRSFSYYDMLGEIKYAAQFYSRMLAPLRLFAAELDANGDWVETEDPEAIAALERIQDPGGGRTGLLSSYGRLMFLAGECYLFVTNDKETGEEQWEMLSSDELRVQDGIYIRYKAPSLGAEEFREGTDDEWEPVEGTAVAYRLWQRHPRYSMLADSTMQGVLDLCEELVLLTQAVRARARSRLAGAGILLIDDAISPPPEEPAPDEDPQEDPFLADLTEAMTTPIVDEGAASQIVPLVLRVMRPDTGSVGDLMHHLQLVDPTQLYPETGLRMECIKRLAIGLDMPPEELLGLTDSNHWTAWMINEDTWKAHGQPKAQQLCDDLTASYYRPFLRQTKGEDARRFAVAYDATAIINHPDRTKDAKDLYDKRAIGKRALREAAGFDEEDAPTKEELAEMIGIATRDASLAWYGEPGAKQGGVVVAPGDIVTSDEEPPPDAKATGADVEAGPPDSEPPPPVVGSVMEAARVMGAIDLALLRAREAAGARLRSLLRTRDQQLADEMRQVPNRDLAAALGRERVRGLRAPAERELVAGARELMLDAFRTFGVHDSAAVLIADTVEKHAARVLYERTPQPLADTFPAYVQGLLSARKNGSAAHAGVRIS